MQEGDLFASVCGREKYGYVRTVGLGTTPADLELPGVRKFKSTKLQMQIEARRVADQKVESMQQQLDEMKKQMAEMNKRLSQHGSQNNISQQKSIAQQGVCEEDGNAIGNSYAEVESNDDLHIRRTSNAEQQDHQQNNLRAQNVVPEIANDGRQGVNVEVKENASTHRKKDNHIRRKTPNMQKQHQEKKRNLITKQGVDDEAESSAPMTRGIDVSHKPNNKQQWIGREVLLYSIIRPFNHQVAKGIVRSKDPRTLVGNVPLGPQYCEIVINSVYKIDTELPRPYGEVVTLGFARGRSIAWPTARIEDYKKAWM